MYVNRHNLEMAIIQAVHGVLLDGKGESSFSVIL